MSSGGDYMEDSVEMKDGTIVRNCQLGRLEQFDKRSRNFPIQAALQQIEGASKPRSYSWRCLDRLDQGQEGSCVGFAVTQELIARPSEIQNLDYTFAREKIYWEAQKIDPWNGGAYPGANPRYEGTSVLAGIKVAQKAGYFSEYRWAFGINDLILALGHAGPAVLGISWYEDMFYPDDKGFIKPMGDYAGGHAILANAINVKEGYINLVNSWGRDWGFDGCARVKIEDMDFLLKDDGEACIPMHRITAKRR